ncbi:hypothetical protein [Fervidobacterium gondwanense]|uniref:hypothetical protein n=1 Tax=Fervidobacterium gondwanense TaxID=44754 RepID=UPI003A60A529
MKKLFTVLVALLMVVSIFAAEKPFTLGPNVKYTGTVTFTLTADKDGVSFNGALSDVSASLSLSPTSDTQAGATFGITYTPFSEVTLTLSSITFSTPYFGAYYTTGKQFVNDYFTGRVYNSDGSISDWDSEFKSEFADALKLTFPAVAGLEVYIEDNTTEITGTLDYANWFSDMLLVKYPVAPFTLVGGMYVAGGYYTVGANVFGTVDLGIFKPSVDVFAGMVDASSANPKTVYGVTVSGSLSPVAGLTLAPTLKYTDGIANLVYKSNTKTDGKFAQLGVTYTTTFAPVTVTAKVTPKYDMQPATPTFKVPLNELSAKVAVTPVTLFVKTTETDLIDSTMKFTLYTQADYADAMLSATAKAEWADVTELATYTYIHVNGSVNVVPGVFTVGGNFRMTPSNNGFNASFKYVLTPNVNVTGFYGTLTGNDSAGWTINSDPTWNLKLTYSASF